MQKKTSKKICPKSRTWYFFVLLGENQTSSESLRETKLPQLPVPRFER